MKVRSVLYLPASNPRAIEKARTLDCDVAVLDLEDAVAPEAKADARVAAIEAAVAGGFGPKLAVRINALDTPWAEEDLQALKDAPVFLIVAPKIEDDQQVKAISDVLRLDQKLWAMVETPKALVDLKDIASAGGVLSGLMLGVNDLAKEMKTGQSPDMPAPTGWWPSTACSTASRTRMALPPRPRRVAFTVLMARA